MSPTASHEELRFDAPTLAVLGPVLVAGPDGLMREPAGRRAKSLLAELALARGRVVSRASLVADVWDGEEPSTAALHTLVSRTRAMTGGDVVITHPSGYRLGLAAGDVDLFQYEALIDGAADAVAHGFYAPAIRMLADARALWRSGEIDEQVTEVLAGDIDAVAAPARKKAERLNLTCLLETADFVAAETAAASLLNVSWFDETIQAAYLRALHGQGRTAEALDHYRKLDRAIRDTYGMSPSPVLTDVHKTLLDADRPAAQSTTITGVRSEPTELIGREDDLAMLDELMQRSRLTTILGVGGLGKTRLAHEIGLRANRAGLPRVVLVELASVRSEDDVLAAFASALGLGESTVSQRLVAPDAVADLHGRLAARLAEQRTLLIADNCEHVLSAVGRLLGELLGAAGDLRVLTTSRAPLAIAGERVYQLDTLGHAPGASAASLLFRDRARAARPGVKLDDEIVERLCARLDGLPLAIELAAAKVRTMTIADIERRLDRRFSLLIGADVSAPVRHRTLLAVIDWSWNLLGETEKTVMRRLARFPAGFSAAAARTVATLNGLETDGIQASLDVLVNQSLLGISETADGMRYRMLETVREFAEMALSDSGEEDAVGAAMIAWARDFTTFDAVNEPRSEIETHRRVRTEHDNLQVIVRWAREASDPDSVVSIGAALSLFWTQRGTHNDVAAAAPELLSGAAEYRPKQQNGDSAALLAALTGVTMLVFGKMRETVKARKLIRRVFSSGIALAPAISALARIVLVFDQREKLEAELAELRESPHDEARTLANLVSARGLENEGLLAEALSCAREAHRLSTRTGDFSMRVLAAQAIAELHSQSGRPEQSEPWRREAIDGLQQFGAESDVARLQWMCAANRIAAGDADYGTECVVKLRDDGAENGPIRLLAEMTLAEAELAVGRIDAGLRRYREAVETLTPSGGSLWWSTTVSTVLAAHVLCEQGDQARLAAWARSFRLRTLAARRLMPGIVDKPAGGMVVLAIGAWLASPAADGYLAQNGFGHDDRARITAIGIELVTLAEQMRSRQDVLSMRHSRHIAKLEADHGSEAVERGRAAPLSPDDAARRADTLFADPVLHRVR